MMSVHKHVRTDSPPPDGHVREPDYIEEEGLSFVGFLLNDGIQESNAVTVRTYGHVDTERR